MYCSFVTPLIPDDWHAECAVGTGTYVIVIFLQVQRYVSAIHARGGVEGVYELIDTTTTHCQYEHSKLTISTVIGKI